MIKMDNYGLKKVTQGKNGKQSLVFHVYDNAIRHDNAQRGAKTVGKTRGISFFVL